MNRPFNVEKEIIDGMINDYHDFPDISITRNLAISLKKVLENMSWGGYDYSQKRWEQDLAEIAESCGANTAQVKSMIAKLFWSTALIQVWEGHLKKDLKTLWKYSQVMLPRTADVETILRKPTCIKTYVQRVAKDENGYDCSEYVPGKNPLHWFLSV